MGVLKKHWRFALFLFALSVLFNLYFYRCVYPFLGLEDVEIVDVRARDGARYRSLILGQLHNGMQFSKPFFPNEVGDPEKDFSRLATGYYHPNGPFGKVMKKFDWFSSPLNTFRADARFPASLVGMGLLSETGSLAQLATLWSEPAIGAVFLKEGGLASYARPSQHLDFFERNPKVVELSFSDRKPLAFTFVKDAQKRGAMVRVDIGDEWTSLQERSPDRYYHVFVVDIGRGHWQIIAREFLTEEAIRHCMDMLVEEGILCIHTSSRLEGIPKALFDIAKTLQLGFLIANDRGTREKGHFSSEWVFLARKAEYLDALIPTRPVPDQAIAWARDLRLPERFLWEDVPAVIQVNKNQGD
jgi:hypothetical protein